MPKLTADVRHRVTVTLNGRRTEGVAWSLPFDDDRHASARYRRDLVRTLGKQAVEEAVGCRS